MIIFSISEDQLRRLINGAIRDAMNSHPDYLQPLGHRKMRNAVGKRVMGAMKGFAAQAAKGRRQLNTAASAIAINGGGFHPIDPRCGEA